MSEMGARELQGPVHFELLIYQIKACLLISERTMLLSQQNLFSKMWCLSPILYMHEGWMTKVVG